MSSNRIVRVSTPKKFLTTEAALNQATKAISAGVADFLVYNTLFLGGFSRERAGTIIRWAVKATGKKLKYKC